MLKLYSALLLLAASLLYMGGSLLPSGPPPVRARAVEKVKHARGRITPKNRKLLQAEDVKAHGNLIANLPKVTAASWDCRTLGYVPPIVDQGQCGSCWDFSGCGVCTMALIKSGQAKNDGSFRLCEQYVLDCVRSGGCNGDDNTTVTAECRSNGLPNASDYGNYNASEGNCKFKSGVKLWKIQDWGFCTPGNDQSVAATQDIKNAMVTYGPIGCAVAAGSDWDNAGPGFTITGNSDGIDHDVILVGWDDNHNNGDGSKGAWIMRNSWGTSWGEDGYCWIKYGADSIGWEAIWVTAGPSPTPPPGPGPGPVPVGNTSITLSGDALAPGTYQITTISGEVVPPGTVAAIEALYKALHPQKKK